MDDRPQSPPLTDAPNAGDPTPGTLRLGDFIIEGVDRVSEEEGLSDHAIVFYNELITLMNAAGPSWQLIWKERYDKIKEVIIRIHNGEAILHVRQDHPQFYKWSSFCGAAMTSCEHRGSCVGFNAVALDEVIN